MTPQKQHQALIEYLLCKVEQRDWHGVSDAANDLRVLEAEQSALKDIQPAFRPGSVVFTEKLP